LICQAQQEKHEVVDIASGNLRLNAFLWKPARFPQCCSITDLARMPRIRQGMPMAKAAEKLAAGPVRANEPSSSVRHY